MRILGALLAVLVVAVAVPAQDALSPKLRVKYGKPAGVWIGERQPLIVEILAPGWFAGATRFDLPEVPGLIFFESAGRPVVGSEEIDGATYTVRTHELAIFAFREGSQVIPPFSVRFAVAGKIGTRARTEHRLETPEGRFPVKSPSGAEEISLLISTTRLEVTETWSTEPGTHRVGDAVVRRVRFEASDVPGMAFPKIPFRGAEGLAVYTSSGVVGDRLERGDFTGVREDVATYVCERPGTVRLPALVIPWWNLQGEKLERIVLPAVTFEIVSVAPAAAASTTDTVAARPDSSDSPWWLSVFAIVPAAVALIVLGAAFVLRRVRAGKWPGRHRAKADRGEPGAFAALLAACRSDRPRDAVNRLYPWLDRMLPARTASTAGAFTDICPDAELRHELAALERAVLGDGPWTGAALAAALVRARTRLQAGSADVRAAAGRLPTLNPLATSPVAPATAGRRATTLPETRERSSRTRS